MAKQEPAEKQEKNLDLTIEELSQKNKVPPYILAGAKHFYGWGTGKRIPEKEFLEKIDRFKSSPVTERGDR